MKYCSFVFLILSFTCGFGQQNNPDNIKTHTIRLYSGTGYTAVRHEVIDKDRYDGVIIPLGIEWEKQSLKVSGKVFASFNMGNIKSGFDDADVKNISVGLDYNFSIYDFGSATNSPEIFIGPSLCIFTHIREQERIELYDYRNILGILALGPNLGVKGNISGTLCYSGTLRMNIVSFGGHDNFSTAILSPFKGFHSSLTMAIDWQVKERTGLYISYRFDYSNINEWVDFVAGSDILLLGFYLKL
jgi:hypothetical protein